MPATKRLLNRSRQDGRRTKSRLVMYQPESKYGNRNITHNNVQNSNLVLSAFAAGSGSSGGRDGRKIKVKSLSMIMEQTVSGNPDPLRVILYVPKTASDNLTISSFAGPCENSQFWIVKDVILQPNSDNTTLAYQLSHTFPMGLNVEFDGDAGSDHVSNPIKMLISCPSNTTVTGHTKVWYTDV